MSTLNNLSTEVRIDWVKIKPLLITLLAERNYPYLPVWLSSFIVKWFVPKYAERALDELEKRLMLYVGMLDSMTAEWVNFSLVPDGMGWRIVTKVHADKLRNVIVKRANERIDIPVLTESMEDELIRRQVVNLENELTAWIMLLINGSREFLPDYVSMRTIDGDVPATGLNRNLITQAIS